MYERWCERCQKPQKCRNDNGTLVCITCKNVIGEVRDE